MADFKRSRLERKKDEQITKKTVFMGFLTVLIFVLIVVFGLPLLIKFSIILGNSKSKKDITNENIVPPLAPRLIVPFEATSSSKIKIDGFAEAGAEVELLKNEQTIGTTEVTVDGNFSFTNIELDDGENNFSAIATKENSGTSEISKIASVIYDTVSPELTMSNPSENSLTVDSADFDIIGKSEKGVSVTINGKVAVVDSEGNFKLKIQLSPSKNNIEIIVKDEALNETKKTISITYDI